jgi:hypothetical protein
VISRIFNPATLSRDYLIDDQSLIMVLSNFVINHRDIIYKEAGNKYIAKFKTAYFVLPFSRRKTHLQYDRQRKLDYDIDFQITLCG